MARVLLLYEAAAKAMSERGSGSILNVVMNAEDPASHSTGAEAGMILGLTRHSARELADRVSAHAAVVRPETDPAALAGLCKRLAEHQIPGGQVFQL